MTQILKGIPAADYYKLLVWKDENRKLFNEYSPYVDSIANLSDKDVKLLYKKAFGEIPVPPVIIVTGNKI